MANIHDKAKNQFMLTGSFEKKGYNWWWHSFTAYNEKTGKARPFSYNFLHVTRSWAVTSPVLVSGEIFRHM